MGYEYLLTLIKVIVGLITPQRMMYISIITFGVFLLWVVLALIFSFQRKFYANSAKLYSLLKNNKNSTNKEDLVKNYSAKISSGFAHGWKRFSAAESGRPSDYISRYDAIDSEVNGGVLNQGKSIMKSFIWLMTTILLVVNLAYHGGENAITFSLIVESSVLPILFFCVLKVFYYLYTIVRQQLYKLDVECYYDLIELLDEIFAKKIIMPKQKSAETFEVDKNINLRAERESQNFATNNEVYEPKTAETLSEKTKEEVLEEDSEDGPTENLEIENMPQDKESNFEKGELYEESEQDILEKYDVFKKKNIDVNSLNEVPTTSKTLPFINVDSDYVIKDDEDPALGKRVSVSDNGSTVLGVIQDMNSVKKAQETDFEKSDEEPENSEAEAEQAKNEEPEEIKETEDALSDDNENVTEEETNSNDEVSELENSKDLEEVEESEIEEDKNFQEEPLVEAEEIVETAEAVDDEAENVDAKEVEGLAEETDDNEEKPETLNEQAIEANDEEVQSSEELIEEPVDLEEEKLASIVGGFKSKNSKLANGGVVIERSSPITRRNSRSTTLKEFMFNNSDNNQNSFAQPNYSNGVNGYNNMPYNANYMAGGAPTFAAQNNFVQPPISYGEAGGFGYGTVPPYSQTNESYNNLNNETVKQPEKISRRKVQEEKPKVTKTEQKPKTIAVKKSSSLNKPKEKEIMENSAENTKRRGRPKKQVFDDEVTINSDKEFNDVLSRAEKLMRKSEEGLSASQSKRIEKELKMLMDAMNKYKEKR